MGQPGTAGYHGECVQPQLEHPNMPASISYATPHPALSHLSIDQICEMHALFMKGATVKSLLAEYGIETTQKQLQPLLPLRILNDQPCPGCGAPLQQKWATKTYGLPPASASPVAISSSVFAPVGTACASDSSVQTESGLISGCRSHSFASNTKYCLCHCC